MRDEKDLFVNVKVCYFFIDMLEKKEGKKNRYFKCIF